MCFLIGWLYVLSKNALFDNVAETRRNIHLLLCKRYNYHVHMVLCMLRHFLFYLYQQNYVNESIPHQWRMWDIGSLVILLKR